MPTERQLRRKPALECTLLACVATWPVRPTRHAGQVHCRTLLGCVLITDWPRQLTSIGAHEHALGHPSPSSACRPARAYKASSTPSTHSAIRPGCPSRTPPSPRRAITEMKKPPTMAHTEATANMKHSGKDVCQSCATGLMAGSYWIVLLQTPHSLPPFSRRQRRHCSCT